jgi:hypothetical protein
MSARVQFKIEQTEIYEFVASYEIQEDDESVSELIADNPEEGREKQSRAKLALAS